MSSRICRSICAESSITPRMRFCSASSGECASTSSMPSTPLIGVRISWLMVARKRDFASAACSARSEEHTSELQSQSNLVCRLLLEKKKKTTDKHYRQQHETSIVRQESNRT